MDIIQTLEKEQAERLAAVRAVPDFQPGDTLQVNVKVKEGDTVRFNLHPEHCMLLSA